MLATSIEPKKLSPELDVTPLNDMVSLTLRRMLGDDAVDSLESYRGMPLFSSGTAPGMDICADTFVGVANSLSTLLVGKVGEEKVKGTRRGA